MWILASHNRPHNVRRFFKCYQRTRGSTPGVVCIDDDDSRRLEYEALEYPAGWKLLIYPRMSMVARVNQAMADHPGLAWYGNIDDDSVPLTPEWDQRLVDAAGTDRIAHCFNGIGNDQLVCQCVVGGDLARDIGWLLLPTTERLYGDNALTDIGRKRDCITYLPDVRVEQYHFTNGKAPMDATYEKPSAAADRKAYIDWYWRELAPPSRPLGDELIVCCVMVKNYEGMGADYVNILHRAVTKNLTVPHRFVCFTDIPHGIECETRPIEGDGWYAKLFLFKEFTQGRVIFFDLDTLIVGNIDYLADYTGEMAMLRNFYSPANYGSGVMLWRGGFGHHITDAYVAEGCPDIPGGDQVYIERHTRADLLQELFPGQVISYKVHAANAIPANSSVVCFHGFPHPHQAGGWVELFWTLDPLKEAEFAVIANTGRVDADNNIRSAVARDYPWVEPLPAHDGQAVIVGGGPSLARTLPEIRQRVADGQTVFALNGAARFLNEQGIIPHVHVIIDARPENARFILESRAQEYMLASQCAPEVFAAVGACLVGVFHMNTEGIADILPSDREATLISSGTTVGLAAMALAYVLGYRAIHLHGFDSSYETGHHAYPQASNDTDTVVDVMVGDRVFKAAPWMVVQAQQFQILATQLIEADTLITVAGDGLLPHMAHCMTQPQGEPHVCC